MNAKRAPRPTWTSAARARHKAVREEFKHRPSQEELEATGAYEGPIKSGAYFAVRIMIHELKQARRSAGLTLAQVAKRTGMDQATLSRLENGRKPNPTIDTLWRYARAVGWRLVLGHEAAAAVQGNRKPAQVRGRQEADKAKSRSLDE